MHHRSATVEAIFSSFSEVSRSRSLLLASNWNSLILLALLFLFLLCRRGLAVRVVHFMLVANLCCAETDPPLSAEGALHVQVRYSAAASRNCGGHVITLRTGDQGTHGGLGPHFLD